MLMLWRLIYVACFTQIEVFTLVTVILTTNYWTDSTYITSIVFKHIILRIRAVILKLILSIRVIWMLGVIALFSAKFISWICLFDLRFLMYLVKLNALIVVCIMSALTKSNWKILFLLFLLTTVGFRQFAFHNGHLCKFLKFILEDRSLTVIDLDHNLRTMFNNLIFKRYKWIVK